MDSRPTSGRPHDERRAQWVQAQRAALRGFRGLPPLRRILAWLVPGGALLFWLASVLVRLLAQDRVPELAYLYYATPPAVLAAVAGAAGAWWLACRRWRLAAIPLVLMLGCLVWTYQVAWFHHRPADSDQPTTRVLFWNVAHGTFGWERIADRIRQYDADVVALVEGGDEFSDQRDEMELVWQRYLPEYRPCLFGWGITLLTRIDAALRGEGMLGGDERYAFGWYVHCEVSAPDGPWQLVIADFQGIARRSRYLPMRHLHERLEPLADQPVLLVGDLNMPTDSVFLRRLRETYRHAFETAGSGYAATWPVPLPVLTLDQAWYNAGVQVHRCELGWTWASDHRPMILEVSLARFEPESLGSEPPR